MPVIPRHAIGVISAIVSALCFSSAGLLMRELTLGTWEIVFWRCVFAGGAIGLYLIARHRRKLPLLFVRAGWPALGAGVLMAYMLAAYCVALKRTLVSDTVACLAVTPFLTALLGLVFLKERVPLVTWLAMVGALAGILMIVANALGQGSALGDWIALSLAVVYAGYIVVMRRGQATDMAPAALYATLIGALVALPLALPFSVQAGDLPYLAAFGVVQLAGGLLFFTLASRVVPAGELSLLMLIETVAGPIWAWLGVGEAPAGLALGGALVVLAATTINAGFALRRTPVAAAATQAGLPKPR